jgi:hypothetical protein
MYIKGAQTPKGIPYSRKIWRELNLADWPPPARTKILADSQVRTSHAPNLVSARACLRLNIDGEWLVDDTPLARITVTAYQARFRILFQSLAND